MGQWDVSSRDSGDSVTFPFHVIGIIGTILLGGPRLANQRSASVLGINSSEPKLNKSADLQLTKPIVNSHFIYSIKKRNIMQLHCDILRYLF